jgi:hypothetical protein
MMRRRSLIERCDHDAISDSERRHPSQSPVFSSMTHILTQGLSNDLVLAKLADRIHGGEWTTPQFRAERHD